MIETLLLRFRLRGRTVLQFLAVFIICSKFGFGRTFGRGGLRRADFGFSAFLGSGFDLGFSASFGFGGSSGGAGFGFGGGGATCFGGRGGGAFVSPVFGGGGGAGFAFGVGSGAWVSEITWALITR